jgi:hypothetical protein
MAIYIGVGQRDQVIGYLKRICPCFEYETGKYENVKIGDEKKKYARLTAYKNIDNDQFCDCYCAHMAGCNLIFNLINHKGKIAIRKNSTLGEGSKYEPTQKTVEINKWKRRDIDTNKGKKRAKPYLKFAHELIHALDDLEGRLDLSDGKRQEEENAVRGSNQIRKELGFNYHRTTHDGQNVPQPTRKYLDESDKFGCKCRRDRRTDRKRQK